MTSVGNYRFDKIVAGLAIKAPCQVATSANITLSGEQTVNSVAVTEWDRVLVKDQTDATENGIYSVQTSAWERAPDWDGNRDVVPGTVVPAYQDSDDTFHWWMVTPAAPNPFKVDVHEVSFVEVFAGGGGAGIDDGTVQDATLRWDVSDDEWQQTTSLLIEEAGDRVVLKGETSTKTDYDERLEIQNASDTVTAWLGHDSTNSDGRLVLHNEILGSPVEIRSIDFEAGDIVSFYADPNATIVDTKNTLKLRSEGNDAVLADGSYGVKLLMPTGDEVAKTVARTSGGLEVYNTETGSGYERVLTESDLSGSFTFDSGSTGQWQSGSFGVWQSGSTNTVNSGSTWKFDDNAEMKFGTGSDVAVDFDGTNFVIAGTGDFNITGFTDLNFGGLGVITASYGEMYISGNSTATTVTVADTYYQITAGLTTGILNEVTFSTDELVVTGAGTYKVDVTVSFTGAANDTFTFGIAINDTVQAKSEIERKTSNVDVGALALQGLFNLSASDTVTLWGKNQLATNDFTVREANVTVTKVG